MAYGDEWYDMFGAEFDPQLDSDLGGMPTPVENPHEDDNPWRTEEYNKGEVAPF